jgi:predicted Rossmann-fold nucleotide-binding protein
MGNARSAMIVGVMASGKKEPLEDEEKRLANEVGTAIAELGYLTGGGGVLRAADLVVILPGGSGTLSELQLAWEYGKEIGKPDEKIMSEK